MSFHFRSSEASLAPEKRSPIATRSMRSPWFSRLWIAVRCGSSSASFSRWFSAAAISTPALARYSPISLAGSEIAWTRYRSILSAVSSARSTMSSRLEARSRMSSWSSGVAKVLLTSLWISWVASSHSCSRSRSLACRLLPSSSDLLSSVSVSLTIPPCLRNNSKNRRPRVTGVSRIATSEWSTLMGEPSSVLDGDRLDYLRHRFARVDGGLEQVIQVFPLDDVRGTLLIAVEELAQRLAGEVVAFVFEPVDLLEERRQGGGVLDILHGLLERGSSRGQAVAKLSR